MWYFHTFLAGHVVDIKTTLYRRLSSAKDELKSLKYIKQLLYFFSASHWPLHLILTLAICKMSVAQKQRIKNVLKIVELFNVPLYLLFLFLSRLTSLMYLSLYFFSTHTYTYSYISLSPYCLFYS